MQVEIRIPVVEALASAFVSDDAVLSRPMLQDESDRKKSKKSDLTKFVDAVGFKAYSVKLAQQEAATVSCSPSGARIAANKTAVKEFKHLLT